MQSLREQIQTELEELIQRVSDADQTWAYPGEADWEILIETYDDIEDAAENIQLAANKLIDGLNDIVDAKQKIEEAESQLGSALSSISALQAG